MRRFTRLENADGTSPWYIPMAERSESYTFPYRTAVKEAIGADGGFDVHGDFRSPKGAGRASISFMVRSDCPTDLDVEIAKLLEEVEGRLAENGNRKLWRWDVADGSGRRFTWCRPTARPAIRRGMVDHRSSLVRLEFVCRDPLFYAPLTTSFLTSEGHTINDVGAAVVGEPIAPHLAFAEFSITSSPTTVTINNLGELESGRVIFRLESQNASGFTNPQIDNLTSGHGVSSTRDGVSSSDILSLNASPGLGRAQYSSDAGVTFADDTNLLSLASATQAQMMQLQPGDNSIRYTDGGTPSLKLLIWWLHAYRD